MVGKFNLYDWRDFNVWLKKKEKKPLEYDTTAVKILF